MSVGGRVGGREGAENGERERERAAKKHIIFLVIAKDFQDINNYSYQP